jgi:hypothetical protein
MAATLIGHAAWAAQGVVIVEKTTVNGAPETHQIQITPQRMRADIAGANGLTTVVFDATKQVLYLINTDRMTYSEMTKAEAEQMGAQLSGMMAQMQEALKSMPPEQRAQMEAMMKGRGLPSPTAGAVKTTYKKGGTQRVGKWTCDVYEMQVNEQRTGELCGQPQRSASPRRLRRERHGDHAQHPAPGRRSAVPGGWRRCGLWACR